MSVTGEFGTGPRQTAERLLRHNCVHFLATDCHRTERRPPILSRGRDAAARIIGEAAAHRLVYENPLAVVNGEALEIEAPIPFAAGDKREKKGFLSRFFG
jgi:protein-tyrosine phosphatase